MAVCPECFELDKNFWAPRCHHCNQSIGFFRQLLYQMVYVFGSLWLVFWILSNIPNILDWIIKVTS